MCIRDRAEHLESTAVREDGAVPARELMQSTQSGYVFVTRTQMQMIGVAQHYPVSYTHLNNRDVNPTAFFIAAVIYLALTFLLTLLSQWCEKRFSRHEYNKFEG